MSTSQWGATIEDKTKKVLAFGSTIQSVTFTRSLNQPAELEASFGLEGTDTKALLDQVDAGGVFIRLAENGTTRFFGPLSDLQVDVADDTGVSARFTDLAGQYASQYLFNGNSAGKYQQKPFKAKATNTIVDELLDNNDALVELVRSTTSPSASVTTARTLEQTGQSRLEVLQTLAGLQGGIDWYVDPAGPTADATFVMAASLGSNLSSTVRFQFGSTGRSTIQSATVQYQPPRNRVWLVKDDKATRKVNNTTSVTAFGEYAAIVQAPDAGAAGTEDDYASGIERAEWRRVVEAVLEPAFCPRPFVDFNLGDTVGLDLSRDNLSLSTSQRVNSITISLDEGLVESSIQAGFEVI